MPDAVLAARHAQVRSRDSGSNLHAAKRDQNARRRHQPDQLASRNDISGHASREIAENESERAPQPHRPIGSSPRRKALECIGFRQRHHWRVEKRRQCIGDQNRDGARGKPHKDISGNARDTRKDQDIADGIAPVGLTGHHWYGKNPRHHRHRQDDTYQASIHILGFEPDGKEGHLDAGQNEQGRVKRRQARHEAPECLED